MTAYKEPHFSYTEATLRREVHTDNSHWELMYKAMLAQLMTYVDASVVRALAERGVDHLRPSSGSGGRGGAPTCETARPASADASQGHRYDAAMSGQFGGIPIPPWLQPFNLPEQVRFTRTPDALLRHALLSPASDQPCDGLASEADAAVPIWKRPVVLPANVRFNRTPDPKPFGNECDSEGVEAQTFTDDAALLPAGGADHAEPSAEPAASSLAEPGSSLPAWFDTMPVDPPASIEAAREQTDSIVATDMAAEPVDLHEHDDLASAWLKAHEKAMAGKALRLTSDQSLGEVLAAVEAVALDPEASMNPYGDSRLWAAYPELKSPAAESHPFGDPAFWIEGLAEPVRSAAATSGLAAAESALVHEPSLQPFGLAGLDFHEAGILNGQVAPEALALPAPDWLLAPAPQSEVADASEAVPVATQDQQNVPILLEAAVAPIVDDAAEAGPYGDSALWLTLIGADEVSATESGRLVDAVSAEAASPLAPVGIASPADARSFVGPARAGIRRGMGTPHGLAPFEAANRVRTDPALYEDPPLDLLMLPPEPTGEVLSSGALEQNARLLEGVLEEFGIRGEIIDVRPGPVVTLYELEPAPGTKSSRVIGLADDIARSMSAVSARVAVVQGRNVIGIELPNQRRETVFLRELVASTDFTESKHKLAIALGKTIGGETVIVDLARMPHLLVAGTTGSGKSVAINTMILSILYQLRPEQCRLIMIDPKMLELSIYEGIPHLLTPVVTDPKKAVVALKWAVREMEDRYKKMAKVGVRNIDGFNARVVEAAEKGEVITRTIQSGFNRDTGEPIFETEQMELSPLPYIVIIVDEMADLMMVAGKDIEGAIQRLAQMARAAGIHLIMATQRPSVDVITGTIKANFPTRISFQVTSKIDSRTILGEQGAEQLLGQGDMLHMAGGGRISRVHGPFVSDGEVEKVVAHLKNQGHPAYLDVVVAEEGSDEAKPESPEDKPVFDRSAMGAGGDDDSDLYDQAVKVVLRDKKCSTSYIQRRLQVGYNKAASLVERMEKEGIVGQANNAGKREILVYSRDLRFTESRDGED